MFGNILVTCSTGGLGTLTINVLLAQKVPPETLFAQTRDLSHPTAVRFAEKGVTVRKANYNNEISIKEALVGIETLIFISSGDFDRWGQHENVLNCIKDSSNLKYIIYTSYIQCDKCKAKCKVCQGHLKTEEGLKKTGIPYTIFRMTLFPEYVFFDMMGLAHALTSGLWNHPAGSSKVNLVARSDVAEALYKVLTDQKSHENKTYEIVSGNSTTFSNIAHILSKVIGKIIVYEPMALDAYATALKKEGYPDDHVEYLEDGANEIADGKLDIIDPALENILGRKPKSMIEYVPMLFRKPNDPQRGHYPCA